MLVSSASAISPSLQATPASERSQADGTITSAVLAIGLAQHLLGVLIGVRVLARVRP
jgi:hypothetical protein